MISYPEIISAYPAPTADLFHTSMRSGRSSSRLNIVVSINHLKRIVKAIIMPKLQNHEQIRINLKAFVH